MKNLETILNNYQTDIKFWSNDFGEGHLFLNHRKQLIPYEDDYRVKLLDEQALKVITNDNSKGTDKLFLKEVENLIHNAKYHKQVA